MRGVDGDELLEPRQFWFRPRIQQRCVQKFPAPADKRAPLAYAQQYCFAPWFDALRNKLFAAALEAVPLLLLNVALQENRTVHERHEVDERMGP